ncbi:Putative calcium-binding protein CML19 [Dendrobium catenatum]|uniref:Calcium-binding protein CML19 n=1 Tax=Dendrobium catenatum TaxID=906689 RepID=A0A2I0WTC6_9ASPA|nr:Putative calcium-binding protein CML19 [Dendrobium catenatum]
MVGGQLLGSVWGSSGDSWFLRMFGKYITSVKDYWLWLLIWFFNVVFYKAGCYPTAAAVVPHFVVAFVWENPPPELWRFSCESPLLMMRTTGEKLSSEDIEAMLQYADSDGDGFLDMEEFMAVAGIIDDACHEVETKKEEQYLKEAFSHYEIDDHQGFINAKSLKRMLSRLGTSRPIEDCQSMICRFDLNRDGLLSFDEFKVMMML